MTIKNTLIQYGFEITPDHRLWWGVGSLVWGYTVTVTEAGKDLYRVDFHAWEYNCEGDPVKNSREVKELHGGALLAYLFERLPWCYLYRR